MGATTKGRWSYACSKAIDEFMVLAHWRENGLPVTIARLFNTVGLGRRDDMDGGPDVRQAGPGESTDHSTW